MKKMLALICGVVFASTLAFAQEAFEDLDTDADGMLSAAEVANLEDFDFVTADTNQDGSISVEEYEAAIAEE